MRPPAVESLLTYNEHMYTWSKRASACVRAYTTTGTQRNTNTTHTTTSSSALEAGGREGKEGGRQKTRDGNKGAKDEQEEEGCGEEKATLNRK